MKTCEHCGNEIDTKDGDNECPDCERKELQRVKNNNARRLREAALRSCGLTKVRGSMGGTYWE